MLDENDSNLENDRFNLILPHALFINGISLNLNDTSSCQETQIDLQTCSDNDVGCENKIVPDPRHYGLNDDFIFVEKEWGSLFYKHIGKRKRSEAQKLCSNEGPSVHLPIPRFSEEHEFYKTYFGDENPLEGLWLDVIFDPSEGVKSENGHSYIKFVRTYTQINDQNGDEEVARIKYHDWINLGSIASDPGSYQYPTRDQGVFMNNVGEWDVVANSLFWSAGRDLLDAVCIYNITPG